MPFGMIDNSAYPANHHALSIIRYAMKSIRLTVSTIETGIRSAENLNIELYWDRNNSDQLISSNRLAAMQKG